jgi:hypothetical protein
MGIDRVLGFCFIFSLFTFTVSKDRETPCMFELGLDFWIKSPIGTVACLFFPLFLHENSSTGNLPFIQTSALSVLEGIACE